MKMGKRGQARKQVVDFKGKRDYINQGEKMDLQERIVIDPGILVGKPIIKGSRLAVEFVIDLLANGWTREEILGNYPGLTPEDIQACLVYVSRLLHEEKVYPLLAS